MIKPILAISLIFALLAPALLTYSWLQYQKGVVKHEVKWRMINGIDKDELVLIKLSRAEAEAELHWEHSKEFEYRDQMYDVVDTRKTRDSVYYWCWWDHEETKLNRNLAQLVEQTCSSDHQNQLTQTKLISFFLTPFQVEDISLPVLPSVNNQDSKHHTDRFFISRKVAPSVPPPKVS